MVLKRWVSRGLKRWYPPFHHKLGYLSLLHTGVLGRFYVDAQDARFDISTGKTGYVAISLFETMIGPLPTHQLGAVRPTRGTAVALPPLAFNTYRLRPPSYPRRPLSHRPSGSGGGGGGFRFSASPPQFETKISPSRLADSPTPPERLCGDDGDATDRRRRYRNPPSLPLERKFSDPENVSGGVGYRPRARRRRRRLAPKTAIAAIASLLFASAAITTAPPGLFTALAWDIDDVPAVAAPRSIAMSEEEDIGGGGGGHPSLASRRTSLDPFALRDGLNDPSSRRNAESAVRESRDRYSKVLPPPAGGVGGGEGKDEPYVPDPYDVIGAGATFTQESGEKFGGGGGRSHHRRGAAEGRISGGAIRDPIRGRSDGRERRAH